MSVLVIGGDTVSPICELLRGLGVTRIEHWSGRKKGQIKKNLPASLDCVVMLTDFLQHNIMYKYKSEAKKLGIPCVCAKRSKHSVQCEFCKVIHGGVCPLDENEKKSVA